MRLSRGQKWVIAGREVVFPAFVVHGGRNGTPTQNQSTISRTNASLLQPYFANVDSTPSTRQSAGFITLRLPELDLNWLVLPNLAAHSVPSDVIRLLEVLSPLEAAPVAQSRPTQVGKDRARGKYQFVMVFRAECKVEEIDSRQPLPETAEDRILSRQILEGSHGFFAADVERDWRDSPAHTRDLAVVDVYKTLVMGVIYTAI